MVPLPRNNDKPPRNDTPHDEPPGNLPTTRIKAKPQSAARAESKNWRPRNGHPLTTLWKNTGKISPLWTGRRMGEGKMLCWSKSDGNECPTPPASANGKAIHQDNNCTRKYGFIRSQNSSGVNLVVYVRMWQNKSLAGTPRHWFGVWIGCRDCACISFHSIPSSS